MTARSPRGPGGARGFDAVLTPAGLAAVQAAAPFNLQGVRHWFVNVLTPAQLRQLTVVAQTVTAHLAANTATTSPSSDRGSYLDLIWLMCGP